MDSLSLYSATPVIAQWPTNTVTFVAEMGVALAQRHGLLLIKADVAIAAAEYRICQEQRLTLSPRHGTVPQVGQPVI